MKIVRKGYWRRWRRRGYERLEGSSGRVVNRRGNRVEIGSDSGSGSGSGSTRKRRFWRIKIVPKLRRLNKAASPKKLLVWLRDAYVKMMLRLANSPMISAAGYGGSGFEGLGPRGPVLKEYDEKMLVEIYKSIIMAQGSLVQPATQGKITPS